MTTLPEAVAQMIVVVSNFETLTDELGEWVTGTLAGTDGTGLYPFTQPDGTIIRVPSPLKMLSMIGGKYEGLFAAQSAQQQAVNGQLATFGTSVDQVKAWLSGPANGGLFGNGLYPITLSTNVTVNIPSPARLAADRQTVAAIVGSGSLIALVEDRAYATYDALIAAAADDGKWALVHSDADYGRNGYYLREGGFWVMKVSLASEALLTALGDNLRGLVRTQNIGRQAEPSKIGTGVTSANLLLWNDPVQAGGKVTGIWLFAGAAGTIRMQSYSKSGTTVTKKRVADLVVPGTGFQLIPADFIVDAGDYIGLQGQGIITATQTTADAGGWWDILADLPTRTVGTPVTNYRLEAQFQISTVQQVVNAGAMLDMAAKVTDLLTRVSKAEAQLALLQGEITQLVGIARTPETGSGVSTSMFIWADPMAHDGYLNELRLFAVGTGTMRLARYSRVGNEVTREQQVMIPITSTGLKTLTAADFGLFSLKAGEHIALYGPGIFTSKVETQRGLGWWGVNADANPRTVGTPSTNIQLHVAFDIRQPIQTVTSDRFLALEAQGVDHGDRIGALEVIGNELFEDGQQIVGPTDGPVTAPAASVAHFIWNAPMIADGYLTSLSFYAAGAGTVTLAAWERTPTEADPQKITRRVVRTFTVSAPGFVNLSPSGFGGDFFVQKDWLLGLHGVTADNTGIVATLNGTAYNGGWWQVVNGLDERSLTNLFTTFQLQVQFKVDQHRQVVTAPAFLEMQTKVDAALGTGGGSLVNDKTLVKSSDWLSANKEIWQSPLIGGRRAQKMQQYRGKRTLAFFDKVANIYGGGSIAGLSDVSDLEAVVGNSAVQIVTTGGNQVTLAPAAVLTAPADVRGGQIRLHYRAIANVFPNIDHLSIELHSAGSPSAPTGNYHRLVPTTAPFDLRARLSSQTGTGLWQTWGVAVNQFEVVGSGADLSAVRFARLILRSSSGNSLTLQVGMIDFLPNALTKAKAILSFDNGYIGHATYSGPQLVKRGWAGVFCLSQQPETHDVQNNRFCSTAQLRRLHDIHGFQMASQAWLTEDRNYIDGLTEPERTIEMQKIAIWMNAMGFTGGEHGSYFSNVGVQDLVAHNMFRTNFRSVRTYIGASGTSGPPLTYGEMYPWSDPMRVRAYGASTVTDSTNGARAIAHAQQAIDNKGVAYFAWHSDQDPGSETYNANVHAGFNELLDWLDANRDQIDVVTEEALVAGL